MQHFNILTTTLPNTINVLGREYKINTDFRTFIRICGIISDSEMPQEKKCANVIREAFGGESLPPSLKETLKALAKFQACSQDEDLQKDNETTNNYRKERVVDFYEDSGLIYVAFLTQYGINLKEVRYLHWWEFLELFHGLSGEHKILEAMKVRACNLSKIKNKQERARMRELKRIYRLKDLRTVEEQEEDIANLFS